MVNFSKGLLFKNVILSKLLEVTYIWAGKKETELIFNVLTCKKIGENLNKFNKYLLIGGSKSNIMTSLQPISKNSVN